MTEEEVFKKFEEVGRQQRGLPEAIMVKIQHLYGGGVLNMVIEHGGDLLHRMTHRMTWGHDGYGDVHSKVKRVHTTLTYPYGFVKEMKENLRNNYDFSRERRQQKFSTFKQFVRTIDKWLKVYSNKHKELPVYNELQWKARQVAVEIGKKDFDEAARLCKEIDQICKKGAAHYREKASEYTLKDGKLVQYTP